MLHLLATLLALQAPPSDTIPPPAALADAYLDAGAGETVRLARERKEGMESALRRYRAHARSRVTLGMRALRRDRVFYRCESAVRVDWRRGEPARVEVLGAREVTPMVSTRVEPGDGGCGGAVFDPGVDRLNFGMGGLTEGEGAWIRHPLAPGSEAHYRFRSGDTVTVRVPGSPPLRLVELEVVPRRSESHLVSGSLWLEGDSHAVVRAVLRLARPFDLERDAAGEEGDLPAVMKPLRADLRYITVEYGLWHQRWWLPRLVAFEGEARAGRLGTFPLRMEQVYSGFEVEGDTAAPAPGASAPSAAPAARGGGAPPACGTLSERAQALGDSLRAAEEGFRVVTGCSCQGGQCRETVTLVPRDTTLLIAGEHLPASIFAEGEELVSRAEVQELIRQVGGAAPAPWRPSPPRLRWGTGALELLRYNRVEGLSLAVGAEWDLGRAQADAVVRLGLADLAPGIEVGVTRTGPARSTDWRCTGG